VRPVALAAWLTGAAALLAGCGGEGSGAAGAAAQTTTTAATATTATAPGRARSITVGTALAAQQILHRSLEDTPKSLDPQLADDVPSMRVLVDLFEGLVRFGPDATPRPGVASSWQITPDGLTWTFHLRDNARWSNGAPVTAADFVYGWRRETDPKTGAEYAEAFTPFVNGDAIINGRKPPDTLGVEALDAHTLQIHLVHPTPYLLGELAQSFMSPAYPPAIRQYGDAWIQPGHMVSNGAFALKENVLGNRITLDRNLYYWDATDVHLTRVVYYIIDDPAQVALRYLAGDVQLTDIFSQAQYPYLESRLGDQVVAPQEFATYMLSTNFKLPPFQHNRALRLALTMSVDRAALTRYLLYGVNQPAYTLMPDLPGYPQPVPAWTKLDKDQRDAMALRLYHQAGYSSRHPLHADIEISTQGPAVTHFFEAIVDTWNSVLGADIGVHEEEFKVLLQDRQLQKLQLFYNGWSGDYLDPYTYLQCFYSTNQFNSGAYSNPRYDALIDQATNEADPTRRYQLFAQAEQLLNDDVAYIPLYYYSDRYLIKPYVKGWKANLMDVIPSRYLYILQHQGN
jgi:oligopeptide transport system substrate-binding protein